MYSRVCFHRDSFTAEMTRNLLTQSGVHPLKLDYSAHVWVAGAEQGYFVEVPDEEVDVAKRILSENHLDKYVVS